MRMPTIARRSALTLCLWTSLLGACSPRSTGQNGGPLTDAGVVDSETNHPLRTPDAGSSLDVSVTTHDAGSPDAAQDASIAATDASRLPRCTPGPRLVPTPVLASNECTTGVWPNLDPTREVCPTISSERRTDPVSGRMLPPADSRTLPVAVSPIEMGSFLPTRDGGRETYGNRIKIVAWNMQYTSRLDDQITFLTTHPDLRDADVYLFSEVDRCSSRNGTRRAAQLLAQRIQGEYVYGIEFVELSIGRTLGGDTGNAIVSRRPLYGVTQKCHSKVKDWFDSDREPRLGQRMFLSADVPAGNGFLRLNAIHFESGDFTGSGRATQVREVIRDTEACSWPAIIAGDTNIFLDGPEDVAFRAGSFVDVLDSLGIREFTHVSLLRLDRMYTRSVAIVSGGVVNGAAGVGLSDHSAIWGVIDVPDA